MTPPVQYFQVVAAAIPATLIAIVMGGKHGEALAKRLADNKGQDNKAVHAVLVTAVIVLQMTVVLVGELAVLSALISGSYDFLRAILGFLALYQCIFVIAYQYIQPVMAVSKTGLRWTVYMGVIPVAFLGGLWAFALVANMEWI